MNTGVRSIPLGRVRGIPVGVSSGDQVRPGNAQVDLDPVKAAPLLVLMGDLDGDAAADQTRKDLLDVGHPASDLALGSFAGRDSMKRDLKGCLHDPPFNAVPGPIDSSEPDSHIEMGTGPA